MAACKRKCCKCTRMLLPSLYVSTLISTCRTCQSKLKITRTARLYKQKSYTERMQTENEALQAVTAEKAAEIKRLRAVLTAFRNPDAIIDQLSLHQLWTSPQDNFTTSQSLGVPVLPSQPGGNLACLSGLAVGQLMPIPEVEPLAQNCSAQPAETLDTHIDLDMFEVSFLP
jgi:hypothetical protein